VSGTHAHALHLHGHSIVHGLAPETKVAALFAFVLAVVATPPRQVWAFGLYAVLIGTVLVLAEIPAGFFFRRVSVGIPFVMFAVFMPFLGGGPRVTVLGLSLSQEGLWGAWTVLAKGSLGISASVMLVATTEIPDILRGLDRLRVPKVLTAIAGFMVRYLDVVMGELRRMRVAMVARGHDPRWFWQARSIALSAGALFIRSFERGERVHQAMAARGYAGTMPDLDDERATPAEWVGAMVVPLTAWAIAGLAVLA
jgi:cobalt/nickel transport system permease protein